MDLQVKLSKLIINNFKRLSYVVLDFDNFTSINGKTQIEGLNDIIDSLKYVFNCFEFESADISILSNENNTSHVEVIIERSGIELKLRKEIRGQETFFLINGEERSQIEYNEAILDSGLILPITNTLIIDLTSIGKVASMDDKKRSNFLEFFGTPKQLIDSYKSQTKIVHNDVAELNVIVKQHNELTLEKKKMSKELDDEEKRNQLTTDYENELKQLQLFTQYHNEKFLESYDENFQQQRNEFNSLRKENKKLAKKLKKSYQRKDLLIDENTELSTNLTECLVEQQNFLENYYLELEHLTKNKNHIDIEKQIDSKIKEDKVSYKTLKKEFEKQEKLLEKRHDIDNEFREFIRAKIDHSANKAENVDIEFSVFVGDEFKLLKNNTEICEKSIGLGLPSLNEIREQIEEQNCQRDEMINEVNEITMRIETFSHEKENLQILSKSIEKFLDQIELPNRTFEELKEKFPGKVFGRIEDLLGNIDEENILIFGKFNKIIVVDTKSTAEDCLKFLKIKQITPNHAIFLILDEIIPPKELKDLLAEELFEKFKNKFIHNIIDSTSVNFRQALMFCLKPSLICDSFDETDNFITLQELKKFNLIEKSTGVNFTKQGFIDVNSNLVKENLINQENLIEKIEEEFRIRIQLFEEKSQYNQDNLKLIEMKLEIENLENSIENLENLLQSSEMIDKLQKYSNEMLETLKNDEQMLRNITTFNDFLSENNQVESFEVQNLKTQQMKHLLSSSSKSLKDLQRFLVEFKPYETNLNDSMNKINQTNLNIEQNQSKVDKLMSEYKEQSQKVNEMLQKISTEVCSSNENIKKLHEIYDNLLSIQNKKNEALEESFDIIRDSFMNWKNFNLTQGSIQDFFNIPDDPPDDFELIPTQLKKIKLNFNKLKANLKDKKINVIEKKFDMEKIVLKLHNQIEEMSKVNVDVSEERLKQKTEDFNILEKKLKYQKLKVKTSTSKLNDLVEQRKTLFIQTVESVNKGMSEFCLEYLNNKFMGSLQISKSDEPYLEDTQFSWTSEETPDYFIDGLYPNHLAALTLMWGILRMKQQKFVIFYDVCKKIYENLDRHFCQQLQLQVISFTSKLNDDDSHYLIRPDTNSSNTFIVKKN